MTGLVLLLLIWAYERSTPATCLYTATHGSYGSVFQKQRQKDNYKGTGQSHEVNDFSQDPMAD
jgi:hypothetical protein